LKKFFKISSYILIGILILVISLLTFGYFMSKKRFKDDNQLAKRLENFESTNAKEYMEYSIRFNKAGNFEEGFKYLNKAVEIDPKSHLGYRGWIRLRKLRDYNNALLDFKRLDSLTPNFNDAPWGEDINFLRGECFYGKKDYKKAIHYFLSSIENQGKEWADVQSFVYLWLCELQLENYDDAIKNFKTGLKQSKYIPEAYFGIAKAYKNLGNLEKAKENILLAEKYMNYKRDDIYNEFLNDIYIFQRLSILSKT